MMPLSSMKFPRSAMLEQLTAAGSDRKRAVLKCRVQAYCLLDRERPTMNQIQQNIRTMFDRTLDFLDDKNSIWSAKVAFADAVARAKTAVTAIDTASDAQQKPTTGVTQDKDAARSDLEEATLTIAHQLSALATKTQDMDLASQVEMTKSSLDRLLDNDLEQAA